MSTEAVARPILADAIVRMAGEEGWSHHDAETAYRSLAARMILHGVSPRMTYKVLDEAFKIVAREVEK